MSITCIDMCGTSPDTEAISHAFAFCPFDPVVVAMRAERLVELQQLFAEFALETPDPRTALHLGGCPIRVDPAVPADEIWLVPVEGEPFKIVHLRPVVEPLEAEP